MAGMAPQSACQPRPENPRRGWWVPKKMPYRGPPEREAPPAPPHPADGGGIRHAVGIQAVRCRLLRGLPIGRPREGGLPCQQAVGRARHAPPGKGGQRATAELAEAAPDPNPIVSGIVRLAEPPAMSHDPTQAAARTPAWQPFAVILPGLASVCRIWDNNDHGCEGTPRNQHPPRHTTPRPRLRS
jgi:hypothetical protein